MLLILGCSGKPSVPEGDSRSSGKERQKDDQSKPPSGEDQTKPKDETNGSKETTKDTTEDKSVGEVPRNPKGAWTLSNAKISTEYGDWDNSKPYQEGEGEGVVFKAYPTKKFVCVQFRLTANVPDPDAVEILGKRQSKKAQELADAEAIRDNCRMFDLDALTLILAKQERPGWAEKVWVLEPRSGGFVMDKNERVTAISVSPPPAPPWHLVMRTSIFESCECTGLLEIGKPVDLAVLMTVPKDAKLEGATLKIGNEEAVPVEVVSTVE